MEEAMNKVTNLNVIERLMSVHQGKGNKGDVFNEAKSDLMTVFA